MSVQQQLEFIVPRGDWQWLQEKHDFKIGMVSNNHDIRCKESNMFGLVGLLPVKN